CLIHHLTWLREGLHLEPTALLGAAAALSVAALVILPRLPFLRDHGAGAPSSNPCHVGGRKSKAGGLAVCLATVLPALISMGTASPWRPVLLFLLGLFLVGYLDDRHPLTPGWKIILQIPLALFVILSIPRTAWVHTGLPWVLLQTGWIVVMTNAFNIVDVADGLLAGLALPAFSVMGGVLLVSGLPEVAGLCIAACGALLGFLPFNTSPGRIMLGDAGSLPLGGLVALLVLLVPSRLVALPTIAWIVPLTGVVLFEVAWVSVRRIRRGIPPWRGSPHHLIYRLVEAGLTPAAAVLLLATVQALMVIPLATAAGVLPWLGPLAAALGILLVKPLRAGELRHGGSRSASPRSRRSSPAGRS
ncbi:MAG: undecaprenyl/decaprenyl-phosphate alpha-N-acetylglucosaminyl 1-phosphate transferase, partial [Deltaproteobacteria bacterium]|nr:undecaprenyl/decaprenyl-phosphate alpha-N-acetylglucosaminyl 1-phosphate transferase [Deltaproteobacteria bacterium]